MSDDIELRIAPVPPGTQPALAEIEARIIAARGQISLLYQVLLHSAPIAAGWERLLTAVRKETSLPAALRELAILRVAVLNRARHEFDVHAPHALQVGVSQEKIDALRGAELAATLYTPREHVVLEVADAMTRDVHVPEPLFARLRKHFDAQGLVEIVTTVATYNMVSRVLVALRINR